MMAMIMVMIVRILVMMMMMTMMMMMMIVILVDKVALQMHDPGAGAATGMGGVWPNWGSARGRLGRGPFCPKRNGQTMV